MAHAIPSAMYEGIGEELINEMPELAILRSSQVTIAYLVSDQFKKEGKIKPVYAETELIPEKFKWGIRADFAITIYEPNAAIFSHEQKKILIFQQLLKIGVEFNENNGTEKYSLREYDVNDFSIIIKKYGATWQNQPELFDEE